MGGASTYCTQQRVVNNASDIILQCTTGQLSLTAKAQSTGLDIFDVGIIPSNAELTNYCSRDAYTDPA